MSPRTRRMVLAIAACLLASLSVADSGRVAAVRYTLSLASASEHLAVVEVALPPGPAEQTVQLPVWNALYQIRDFAQYINWIHAFAPDGKPLPIHMVNKSSWRIEDAERGAHVRYQIFADQPGPFGAQLNLHHAFFNLAEILLYGPDTRNSPISLRLQDLPHGWRVASPLANASTPELQADNYDRLVDSPVELGDFQETSFDEAGAHYRIVVDADAADYDMCELRENVRKVVIAATSWMQDRPYQSYVFIYHFPRGPGGGGMEHAYSTAIDVNAERLKQNPRSLTDVTAHEFFHLWNVKRIRPQSLEPIDYTKENYTTALWFSEGFTSTASDYIRMRAGLLDEGGFLHAISTQITELQTRPAHRVQSAEDSSLDAWLEKYHHYDLPSRSVSYYNKGYLLGILLDLQLREASNGQACLRDLFQWMNHHFAQENRFFPDTDGVTQAAEAVAHADLHSFFDKYVEGLEEIPYDEFFRNVGLHLVQRTVTIGDPGFRAASNFGALPTVADVSPQSPAANAGLARGDMIVKVGGQNPTGNLGQQLSELEPGSLIQLQVRNARGDRTVSFHLGSREEVEFLLRDLDNVSPQQRARRLAWLSGESQRPGDARP